MQQTGGLNFYFDNCRKYSFSKPFVSHFLKESVRNRVKGEVSHLYGDTVEEKKKEKALS